MVETFTNYTISVKNLKEHNIPELLTGYSVTHKIDSIGVRVYIGPEGTILKGRVQSYFWDDLTNNTQVVFNGELLLNERKIYPHAGEICNVRSSRIIHKVTRNITNVDTLYAEINNLLQLTEQYPIDGLIFTPLDNNKPIYRWKYIRTLDLHFDGTYWTVSNGKEFRKKVIDTGKILTTSGIYEINKNFQVTRKRDDKIKPNSEDEARSFVSDFSLSSYTIKGIDLYFYKLAHQEERKNILQPYSGTILDLGSGNGDTIKYMTNYNKIYLVEPKRDIGEQCTFYNKDIKIIQSNVENLTFLEERFDVISLLFSLTLIENYNNLTYLVKKHLKAGGVVLILTLIYKEDYSPYIEKHNGKIMIDIGPIYYSEYIVDIEKLIHLFSEVDVTLVKQWVLGEGMFMSPSERRLSSYYKGFIFQKNTD